MSFWRWPGRWKPHTVNHLTAHLDVLPTLCDLAGAKIPAELHPKLEGFSLRPLLESDKPVKWQHEDRLLFHHVARWPSGLAKSHKYAMCGVRQGHYLLLRSTPCDDPACQEFSSQCRTLRLVQNGITKITYTKENAQFHWGVSPTERWALWNHRCPDNADFDGELPPLLARATTHHWFDPCELLTESARSELRPEFRKRQRGGGWEPSF